VLRSPEPRRAFSDRCGQHLAIGRRPLLAPVPRDAYAATRRGIRQTDID
jgi:hypothetical protein